VEPQAPPDLPSGALAAQAFAVFNAGIGPREAVVRLGAEPAQVRRLHQEWAPLGGDVVIPAATWTEVQRLVGPVADAASLLVVLRGLVRDRQELRRFTYPCAGCGEPVQARASSEWQDLVEAGHLAVWHHLECNAPEDGG
jgi:hypothetical protein